MQKTESQRHGRMTWLKRKSIERNDNNRKQYSNATKVILTIHDVEDGGKKDKYMKGWYQYETKMISSAYIKEKKEGMRKAKNINVYSAMKGEKYF